MALKYSKLVQKYGTKIFKINNSWIAQVERRRTSRRTTIEKKKTGFTSEEEARKWANSALQQYLKNRKKQREKRKQRKAETKRISDWCNNASFAELIHKIDTATENNDIYKDTLIFKAELLWDEIAWRRIRDGYSEKEATKYADDLVGSDKSQYEINAHSGRFDEISNMVRQASVMRANELVAIASGKYVPNTDKLQ